VLSSPLIAAYLAKDQLRSQASALGFSLFGVAPAQNAPSFDRLQEWIQRGFAGSMSYIPKRVAAYQHPNSVLEGCKSVVMLAVPYASHPLTKPRKSSEGVSSENEALLSQQPTCKIGTYATGQVDYHDWIRDKLNQLAGQMERMFPGSLNRGVVDTAPLLERDFANLAGVGWIGKNTLLLNRTEGSYFFLAALLTSVELPKNDPFEADHCGSCTACLEACPTQAFVGPRILDASKCISYLTIEHRGAIPEELSEKMSDWIFGCDVCQIVCPWNRKRNVELQREFEPSDMGTKSSIEHWLTLDEAMFRRLYRHTPFYRTKLHGMQRNALIAAANTNRSDLRDLIAVFAAGNDEVLRSTSLWCLSKLSNKLPPTCNTQV
jgi:epoxyqueuosine reductase